MKRSKKSMGRKTKYTPGTVNKICSYLKKGNTKKVSALLSGINEDTFYDWMAKFPEFSESVKKAEAEAEESKIRTIREAEEDGEWQAAAWWLERRRREDYALIKREVEMSNKDDKPFKVAGTIDVFSKIAGMSDDEIRARLNELRGAGGREGSIDRTQSP